MWKIDSFRERTFFSKDVNLVLLFLQYWDHVEGIIGFGGNKKNVTWRTWPAVPLFMSPVQGDVVQDVEGEPLITSLGYTAPWRNESENERRQIKLVQDYKTKKNM